MKKITLALALAAILSTATPIFADSAVIGGEQPIQCGQNDGILVSDVAGILVSDVASPGILVSDLAGILVSDAASGCAESNGILVSD